MNTNSKPPAPTLGASFPGHPNLTANSVQTGRRVSSDEIFGSNQEIEIEHNGVLYRLRKTSLGKLILTK